MEDLVKNPDILLTLEFDRLEESADAVRKVVYRKFLFSIDEINFYLEVEFELSISDDPYASYTENRDWFFEDIYFIKTDKDLYEDDLHNTNFYVRKSLLITSVKELKSFIKLAEGFGRYF